MSLNRQRASQPTPGMSRSLSSSSLASPLPGPRPRRININLPNHSATTATFLCPTTGASMLANDLVSQERERYAQLVATNATSEALLKMPNIATKPRSVDAVGSEDNGGTATCNLPRARALPLSNLKMPLDTLTPVSSPSLSTQPQLGLDHRRANHSDYDATGSSTNYSVCKGNSARQEPNARRTSMNPLAASFTPTFSKPTHSDSVAVDLCQENPDDPTSKQDTIVSKDDVVAGLGIVSPTLQSQQELGPQTQTSSSGSTAPADFDPQVFSNDILREVSDKLESGFEKHLSQVISATVALPLSLPQQPSTLPSASPDMTPEIRDSPSSDTAQPPADSIASGATPSATPSVAPGSVSGDDSQATISNLKRTLRGVTTELDRLRDKNNELRDINHQLERQKLEATHQIKRLKESEQHSQFLTSRVKELETSLAYGPSVDPETFSNNGYRHSTHGSTASSGSYPTHHGQHVQRLMREISTLTSERDQLKNRVWDLESYELRPAHYVDLENERNRLVDELGAKTVSMEDLWNKNDALLVRAKEYEKRVWELESQCSSMEGDLAALPRLRSELRELESRLASSESLHHKVQDMEGQVALVKSLQDRVQELETTNAELDHSNWKLSDRLNFANNQHAVLIKEFENFRSKDKDDRRLEFLATKNRDLEQLLAEQSKINPDYKEEHDRVSSELEKLKIRLPQLEGQAKQVILLRNKVTQLEKQIKTMEQLEPRLVEMQQLYDRNMYLEGELGELEQLRAREMELESVVEDLKSRLSQMEGTRTRSANSRQHTSQGLVDTTTQQVPLFESQETDLTTENAQDQSELGTRTTIQSSISASSSVTSLDMALSPKSPSPSKREFPPAVANNASTVSMWPSGRSSMSAANRGTMNRMSTSSSCSNVTAMSNFSNTTLTRSPRESDEEKEDQLDKAGKLLLTTSPIPPPKTTLVEEAMPISQDVN